ncbi:hypothetical protein FORMB_12060 [Formosa sp. Hel1_33_131]|nr:hypothetical protein FORMB_12060 [Formosa sp. Hel1_33_131]
MLYLVGSPACFGLYPWDEFYDSNYFDMLLVSLNKKIYGITYK